MKPRRVELFASSELDILEQQMNLWLDDNSDCHVVDVRFSAQGVYEPEFDIIYTAIIFYEKVSD